MSLRRWLKFSAVGALGVLVQLGGLALLRTGLGVPYLLATALAVEMALLHNFVWHEVWTWRDCTRGRRGAAQRLLRFHATTGAVTLAVNLGLMRLLVGGAHVPYLAANLLAICAGSVANYLCAALVVFRSARWPGRRNKKPLAPAAALE